MKYQVSLNGKQFEVEVEKGAVSAVPTGAAPHRHRLQQHRHPRQRRLGQQHRTQRPAGGETRRSAMPGSHSWMIRMHGRSGC